jgi:site-specific recombinase XerD
VSQRNIDSFIAERLRLYRKKRGRPPDRLVRWRCTYTPVIHHLLRDAQGQWPPPSAGEADIQRFEAHLVERGLGDRQVRVYRRYVRRFVDYLNQFGISVAGAGTSDVDTYFRVALRNDRKRNPNLWQIISRRAVYDFLGFVRGEWPPGSRLGPELANFRAYLEKYRYGRTVIPNYVSHARQFLRYLKEQSIPVEQAMPRHIEGFAQVKLERSKRRHGTLPKDPTRCRTRYSGAIHRLLRMLSPDWPPPEPASNDCEQFQRELLDGYSSWLIDVHGLSKGTLRRNGGAARTFLHWLGHKAGRDWLPRIGVPEIDQYLSWRMPGLRRTTRHGTAQCLRSFLRYLHAHGVVPKDLSSAVSGPVLYKFDDIPRAFSEEQVKAMLDATRQDKTPCGLRDHAILMLLATYGLRAGEVVRLRLDDIDWRADKLRIHQSKTGNELFLPLLPAVGDALLKYLRRGRPQTDIREVFLRARAPLGPFARGDSLHTVIQHRLNQAGIQARGRHGAHAFRYARAVSLLRAGVPVKSIGDMLGHRSAESTGVYLRLATEDLRAISIDVPGKGGACRTGRTKTGR